MDLGRQGGEGSRQRRPLEGQGVLSNQVAGTTTVKAQLISEYLKLFTACKEALGHAGIEVHGFGSRCRDRRGWTREGMGDGLASLLELVHSKLVVLPHA